MSDARAIFVCCLRELPEHARALAPRHLVSLVAPYEQPPTPAEVPVERHLRLEMHDIDAELPGQLPPRGSQIARLVDFLGESEEGPLLLHCMAGISRSMAAALVALSMRHAGREEEAALHLRTLAPHAHPNRRIVRLADEHLGLEGRLVKAREIMGDAEEVLLEGPLVRIPPLG